VWRERGALATQGGREREDYRQRGSHGAIDIDTADTACRNERDWQLIGPWQDRSGRFSALKAVTLALMFAPALTSPIRLKPASSAPSTRGMTYWSGVWATALLLLALAGTPGGDDIPREPAHHRATHDQVTALVYTIAHIIIYFALRFGTRLDWQ
jgi:hypothetical protein